MQLRFPHLEGWQVREEVKNLPTSNVASKLNSSSDFDTVMANAGMQKVNLANYQTIAPLSDMTLTADQIISGVWLKENYDKLPPKQKLRLQLNILTTQASNSIATAGNKMQATLATLNAKVESILIKLGLSISTASVSGNVKDQDGPVANLEVSFGGKVAVTDALGRYTLSRVPTGKFPFKVSDPKTNKTYKTSLDSLTTNNQQMANVNILFTKPTYAVKGQVFYKNAVLANGKLVISDGQTIALDSNGKFNFQLKEGQYKVVIRDKSDQSLSVSNSGNFGDLAKLNVTKNLNSLVWTY